MAAPSRSLRPWRPASHDYRGHAIRLYDGSLLLGEAGHLQVGDYVRLGPYRSVMQYRVRHVAYHPGHPRYWRVCVELLAPMAS